MHKKLWSRTPNPRLQTFVLRRGYKVASGTGAGHSSGPGGVDSRRIGRGATSFPTYAMRFSEGCSGPSRRSAVLPTIVAEALEPVLVLLAVGHGGPFEGRGLFLYLCTSLSLEGVQVGPAEVGLAQVGPAQVSLEQVGPAPVGPA
jgi:hypothetical protein